MKHKYTNNFDHGLEDKGEVKNLLQNIKIRIMSL